MLLRNYVPALKLGAKVLPAEIAGMGWTTGNVYYVIKKTETFYSKFLKDFQCTYSDGSKAVCIDEGATTAVEATAALNTGIQDALNKCVSSRGDYVIIVPSADDYDIGAVLTMTKRNVHLICPMALGWGAGAQNACRVNQVDADASIIKLTGQNCEIAGLYFKPADTYPAITLDNGSWGEAIHHNTFYWTGATSYVIAPITDAGDGGSYSTIENNYFMPAGSSNTTTDVIRIENEAAACRVNGNVCIVANSNICSNVIQNKSTMAEVSNNRVGEAGGTITRAITVNNGLCSGNMIGTSATNDVAPSTNTNGFVGNWSGATGGAAASQAT